MWSTIFVTIAVWTGVALIAGIFIGRRLRRRAAEPHAERPGFRNSA